MIKNYHTAIVRKPPATYKNGITSARLGEPNVELALEQHAAYVQVLRDCGLNIIELTPLNDYPDSCFVEDTCVLTDGLAVITRLGHASRRGENVDIAVVLSEYKDLRLIEEPGTVDGGDVFRVEDHIFIGMSERTNEAGAMQLTEHLRETQFPVTLFPVRNGVHLKSSVTSLGDGKLLITEDLAKEMVFKHFDLIKVSEEDRYAANCLAIGKKALIPAGYPRVLENLKKHGYEPIEVDLSEFRKMDGSVTCLSVLID